MTNPYDSPSNSDESLVTTDPADSAGRKNASGVLLFLSFCVIACLASYFALVESDQTNGRAATERPNQRVVFFLTAVFGFSVYAMSMAAMTVYTSVRWFRARWIESASLASGLCIFVAAAQVIEPAQRFSDPYSRWTIGLAGFLLAIWFAVLRRKRTT